MEIIETGRILTLSSGREYVVVTSSIYENKTYVYVANLHDENDTKVCLYDNNELTEVTDEKFLNTIEELLLQDLMQ